MLRPYTSGETAEDVDEEGALLLAGGLGLREASCHPRRISHPILGKEHFKLDSID